MSDEGKLLLIRGPRRKLVLASAALLLLVLGRLVAPPEQASQPTSVVPDEPVAPLLDRRVLRDALHAGLRSAGEPALVHVVGLAPSETPTEARSVPDHAVAASPAPHATGVVLPGGVVLAQGRRLAEDALRGRVRLDGAALRVRGCDPATGLVVLTAPNAGLLTPARVAAEGPAPGTAAVAVSRHGAIADIAPVLVSGRHQGELRLGLGAAPPGAAIFDTDARLVGVAGLDGRAWTPAAALALAARVPVTVGMVLQPLADDLEGVFTGPGVLVADVVADGPASAAGVRPGDVVTALGTTPVASAAELAGVLAGVAPETVLDVELRRGRAALEVTIVARGSCSAPPAPPAEGGVRAAALFASEALEASGLPAESVVLDVDGAPPPSRFRRGRVYAVRARLPGGWPAYFAVRP